LRSKKKIGDVYAFNRKGRGGGGPFVGENILKKKKNRTFQTLTLLSGERGRGKKKGARGRRFKPAGGKERGRKRLHRRRKKKGPPIHLFSRGGGGKRGRFKKEKSIKWASKTAQQRGGGKKGKKKKKKRKEERAILDQGLQKKNVRERPWTPASIGKSWGRGGKKGGKVFWEGEEKNGFGTQQTYKRGKRKKGGEKPPLVWKKKKKGPEGRLQTHRH